MSAKATHLSSRVGNLEPIRESQNGPIEGSQSQRSAVGAKLRSVFTQRYIPAMTGAIFNMPMGSHYLEQPGGAGLSRSQIGDAVIAAFIQTTLTGTIWLTQALLPLMPASARIVNILADWAMPNVGGPSTFVAGKYGLLGFGRALAAEVRSRGIRVTNLLPGDVASDPRAEEQSAGIPLRLILAQIAELEMTRIELSQMSCCSYLNRIDLAPLFHSEEKAALTAYSPL